MADSIAWVVRDASGVVHRRHRDVSLTHNAIDALTLNDPVERQHALCAGGPSRSAAPTDHGLVFIDLMDLYVLNATPHPLDRMAYVPPGHASDPGDRARTVERLARDGRILTVGAHAESDLEDDYGNGSLLRPNLEDVVARLMGRYGSHLRARVDERFGLDRRVYEVELPVNAHHPFDDARALLKAAWDVPAHGVDLFEPFVRLDLTPFVVETLWWNVEPLAWLGTLQQRLGHLGMVWTDEDHAGWARATAAFRRHLGIRPLGVAHSLAVAA